MRIHYLEVVTDQVDAACAAAHGVAFGEPPLEIPGRGTFAIYIHGRIHHGLWQV